MLLKITKINRKKGRKESKVKKEINKIAQYFDRISLHNILIE